MATSKKVKKEKVAEPIITPIEETAFEVDKVAKKHEVLPEVKIPEIQIMGVEESKIYKDKLIEHHIEKYAQVVEGKTEEQKIVDYVANSHSETVELSPILRSLYPVVSFAEPAKYLHQMESKRIKGLLDKMKNEGLLKLTNDSYLKLGGNYYGNDTKTKHWNIDTVKIVAIK